MAGGLCRRQLSIGYSRGAGGVYAYFFCLGRHRDKRCKLPYLSFEFIEQIVDDYWQQVRLDESAIEAIRDDVKAHIARVTEHHTFERKKQTERLGKIETESKKLLQAYYAEAVSIEMLREEQARLLRERADAEFLLQSMVTEQAQYQTALQEALELLGDASRLYEAGNQTVRRELNHALFRRLYVVPDGIAGADLASPFAQLLTDDLAERLEHEAMRVSSGPAEETSVLSGRCNRGQATPAGSVAGTATRPSTCGNTRT